MKYDMYICISPFLLEHLVIFIMKPVFCFDSNNEVLCNTSPNGYVTVASKPGEREEEEEPCPPSLEALQRHKLCLPGFLIVTSTGLWVSGQRV